MKTEMTILLFILVCLTSCGDDSTLGTDLSNNDTSGVNNNDTTTDCQDLARLDDSRGACTETLAWNSEVTITKSGGTMMISSNGIPGHKVGLFGNTAGSLNPNAIREQNVQYRITTAPSKATQKTLLFNPDSGPQYNFGVLLNGVQVDPEAAEPWPHTRPLNFNSANWSWNLDAMSINLGLDCNNAHVQPTGKYHYHGSPTLYLDDFNTSGKEMIMIGYAADGFPLYYKYGYTTGSTTVEALQSSYQLKSGERPGDGSSAPCGTYSGIYTADYEFVPGLGDLDECNGMDGVTSEYPEGTYYYVITDSYPYVGRCLVGTPSSDFRLR